MRVLLTPAGSRGDIQPLLALGIGLRAAGHQVLIASAPNYAPEVRAFGIDFHGHGLDVKQFVKDAGVRMTPIRAVKALLEIGRAEISKGVDDLLPLVEKADLVVGGGAQISAPTAALAASKPYAYVAYSPQALRSRHHAPFVFPFVGAPELANVLSWTVFIRATRAILSGPLESKRRALGLPPVRDYGDHFFPQASLLLAADPELAPPPPDYALIHPPLGSFHLEDRRPLGAEIEAFLAAGPPPAYIGFGSMTMEDPLATTRLILEAARAAGVRAIVSAGWGELGGGERSEDALVIGPVSHGLLFPRVACVVHHGGAGTTSAAARAGATQLVIPHAFDQFMWGQLVQRAGVGPEPIPRSKLSAAKLARGIAAAIGDRPRQKARELGESLRARDAVASAVAALEAIALRS